MTTSVVLDTGIHCRMGRGNQRGSPGRRTLHTSRAGLPPCGCVALGRPRVAPMLALPIAQLEPAGLAVLAVQRHAKPNLVEIDRQRLERNALEAAAGSARHHNYPR